MNHDQSADDNGALLWRRFAGFMEKRLEQIPDLSNALQRRKASSSDAKPVQPLRVERDVALWSPRP
jgi:hypothetical protein